VLAVFVNDERRQVIGMKEKNLIVQRLIFFKPYVASPSGTLVREARRYSKQPLQWVKHLSLRAADQPLIVGDEGGSLSRDYFMINSLGVFLLI